jgi:uncharacterized protein YjbI with pentapeptide repeats
MAEREDQEPSGPEQPALKRGRTDSKWASGWARPLRHLASLASNKPDPAQTTPRLLRVWITIPFWLLVTGLVAYGIHAFLRNSPDLVGKHVNDLELLKVLLTIMTGIGAVLLGVYAYRKQRLEEGASVRQDEAQFLTRYNAATEQLADDKPAARLAGVYAMARLADDWSHQRQQCVDVLCACLRMPPEDEAGDTEVRATIVRVIADHLRRPDQNTSWSDLDYNFDRAQLHNVDLDDATFNGKEVTFQESRFTGENTSFQNATFSSESTRFTKATFSSESTWFGGATFSGKSTDFHKTTFSGERTGFTAATFSGERTGFTAATFSGEHTGFYGTTFSGESTWFDWATFSSDYTDFRGATFSGGTARFPNVIFGGGVTVFTNATFSGEGVFFARATFGARDTYFVAATFDGESTRFDDATFSSAVTDFDDATFSSAVTDFNGATFRGSRVTFDGAERRSGCALRGLVDPKLEEGATIMKDGQPFAGWPQADS